MTHAFITRAITETASNRTTRGRSRWTALAATLVALGLAACSGAGAEVDEEFEAMELGEHEAALMNDGSGPTENKCTTAWQDCYLECTVTRYPESKDSPSNLNGMLREGCLDSCDAAHRTCSDVALTRPSAGIEVLLEDAVVLEPRPVVTRAQSKVLKSTSQLAR